MRYEFLNEEMGADLEAEVHALPALNASDWKHQVYEAFGRWLDDLPAAQAWPDLPAEGHTEPDLSTLLAEFSALRQEVRWQCRQQAHLQQVALFFGVRDALQGQAACGAGGGAKRHWWQIAARRAPEQERATAALECFDACLRQLGITLVPTVGQPFDPATMRAVKRCSRRDLGDGVVAAELLSGFVAGEQVLRYAEVVVNQQHKPASAE